jgi:hypothetical protein
MICKNIQENRIKVKVSQALDVFDVDCSNRYAHINTHIHPPSAMYLNGWLTSGKSSGCRIDMYMRYDKNSEMSVIDDVIE